LSDDLVNEPEEIFVLDLDRSFGLDLRPVPVSADQEEELDPKVSSALESAESSKSSVKEESESSASQGPFASAGKVSTPTKEDAQTGTPIF